MDELGVRVSDYYTDSDVDLQPLGQQWLRYRLAR